MAQQSTTSLSSSGPSSARQPANISQSIFGLSGETHAAMQLYVRLAKPDQGQGQVMVLREALGGTKTPAQVMLGEIKAFLRSAGEPDTAALDAANKVVICWCERKSGPNPKFRLTITDSNFDNVLCKAGPTWEENVIEICPADA